MTPSGHGVPPHASFTRGCARDEPCMTLHLDLLLRKNQFRLSDKSMVPQRLRPIPWDKVGHIGGAMKSTCYPDRAETNCGKGCSTLLLLFANGAPNLRG